MYKFLVWLSHFLDTDKGFFIFILVVIFIALLIGLSLSDYILSPVWELNEELHNNCTH